jgi:hypothetical protein
LSIRADRAAIVEKLEDIFKGKVGKGFQTLFTDVKVQITVTFAGEAAEKSESINYHSRKLTTRFGVIVKSRSDSFDDDSSLDIIDKIKEHLHGRKLAEFTVDSDKLIYTGTQFNELVEGSGVYAHTLMFEKSGELQPKADTF